MASDNHYPTLTELPDAEIVAVCDLDKERQAVAQKRFDIPCAYSDFHEMLEKEDLDAVFVVVLPKSVFPIVSACIQAGLAVFTEKPAGADLKEAEKLVELSVEHGVKTAVGFNRRFCPAIRQGKAFVDEKGEPPTQAFVEFDKALLGESPVYDMPEHHYPELSHHFDAITWLCGNPTEIHFEGRSVGGHCLDLTSVLMRFENDSIGFLSSNFTGGGRTEAIQYHAPHRSAHFTVPLQARLLENYEETILKSEELAGSTEARKVAGYFQEVEYFIRCIREDKDPELSFENTLVSMRVIDVILDLFAKGKTHWKA